jgi:ribosomal protein S18 acetylase RimI-like enzyme
MIELRPIRQSDMAQCADIINNWIDETTWLKRDITREEVEQLYDHAISNGREGFVGVIGEEVQGYTLFMRADQRIRTLFLKPEARNSGLGGRLIDAVKVELPTRITLTTHQKNLRAQDFYRRHGFVEEGLAPLDKPDAEPELTYTWVKHG